MLLLIDNYDSFTWNLVQYFGALGQEVQVRRNDELSLDEIIRLAPRHLVDLGHRSIAYISGPKNKHDAMERLVGHQRALAEGDRGVFEADHARFASLK